MVSRYNPLAICVMLLCVFAPWFASAGFMTSTYNFSDIDGSHSRLVVSNFSSSTRRNFTDGVSGYLHFNQFDPALGQLTGVQIGLDSSFRHYAQVRSYDSLRERCNSGPFGGCSSRYDDDVSVDGTLSADIIANLTGLFGVTPTFSSVSRDLSCERVVNNARADFATCQNAGLLSHDFDVNFDLSRVDIQRFVGVDTMRLFLDSAVYVNATCNSHIEVLCQATSEISNWQGQLTVTYEFLQAASVSEPGSLVIAAFGLLGLMRLKRARKPDSIHTARMPQQVA